MSHVLENDDFDPPGGEAPEPVRAIRTRQQDAADDDLDMTPMVDVTFLLLIFFMITAAFALQKAIEVPPSPEDQAASVQTLEEIESDSIVVRVDGDNVYWVGCPAWPDEVSARSKQGMRTQVREARAATRTVNKLLVRASGDATHEFVVAALDAGSAAGVEQIRVMLDETEDF